MNSKMQIELQRIKAEVDLLKSRNKDLQIKCNSLTLENRILNNKNIEINKLLSSKTDELHGYKQKIQQMEVASIRLQQRLSSQDIQLHNALSECNSLKRKQESVTKVQRGFNQSLMLFGSQDSSGNNKENYINEDDSLVHIAEKGFRLVGMNIRNIHSGVEIKGVSKITGEYVVILIKNNKHHEYDRGSLSDSIYKLYNSWNTQTQIADIVGVSQKTVSNEISRIRKLTLEEKNENLFVDKKNRFEIECLLLRMKKKITKINIEILLDVMRNRWGADDNVTPTEIVNYFIRSRIINSLS